MLAFNGHLDLQMPPKENPAAIREALNDNPDVTIREQEGLNHIPPTRLQDLPLLGFDRTE